MSETNIIPSRLFYHCSKKNFACVQMIVSRFEERQLPIYIHKMHRIIHLFQRNIIYWSAFLTFNLMCNSFTFLTVSEKYGFAICFKELKIFSRLLQNLLRNKAVFNFIDNKIFNYNKLSQHGFLNLKHIQVFYNYRLQRYAYNYEKYFKMFFNL